MISSVTRAKVYDIRTAKQPARFGLAVGAGGGVCAPARWKIFVRVAFRVAFHWPFTGERLAGSNAHNGSPRARRRCNGSGGAAREQSTTLAAQRRPGRKGSIADS